jgi:Fe-S cluster assembly scaffold protein SufB
MSVLPETKYLKVTFTREQRAEFALELARKTQHLGELDQQKKEVAAALKAQIEEEVAKQQKLARYVNDGYDFCEVEVRWMMNYPRNGQKTAVRIDTEEPTGIVEGMTDAERQADLPFDDEPAAKVKK